MSSVLIVGDQPSAISGVAYRSRLGETVFWYGGKSTALLPVTSSLNRGVIEGPMAQIRADLNLTMVLDWQPQSVREYRNRAFREPDDLAGSDLNWVSVGGDRMQGSYYEWLRELRGCLERDPLLGVKKRTGYIQKIEKLETGHGFRVWMSDGRPVECDQVIVFETLAQFREIQGIDQPLRWLLNGKKTSTAELIRKLDPRMVLQVQFDHSRSVGDELLWEHDFLLPLQKDPGEEGGRRAIGYWVDQGRASSWTIPLEESEGEDNHQILKKIRKLKQTMEKAFCGPAWLGEANGSILDTITAERVRLVEDAVFAGEVRNQVVSLQLMVQGSLQTVDVVLEGLGSAPALSQVFQLSETRKPSVKTTHRMDEASL